MPTPSVTVVGIGADGFEGLSPRARTLLARAEVVIGSPRQLDTIPGDARRETLPRPLVAGLVTLLAEHSDRAVVVLASGDPMDHGLGASLARHGIAADVVPHPSSISLACARLSWATEDVDVVSVVGRPLELVHPLVRPGARFLVLSEGAQTPAAVAALLVARGHADATVTVLEDLGGEERRTASTAAEWGAEVGALNVVAVACSEVGPLLSRCPGLPDEAYEHDGQLTKRDVRATALARLQPAPGQVLWDVGAGAGSIGIEWMRTDPRCRATAFEQDRARADRIGRNARALGVPGLQVVHGPAPTVFEAHDRPHAVFLGGGVTVPGMVEECWRRLRPGGRMLAHAVTLESEAVVLEAQRTYGGELGRLQLHSAEPLGRFTTWRPQLPLTTWYVVR